jgi:hypothetical protein
LQKLEWPFRTHSMWRSSAQQSGTEPRRLLFHGILRQATYHSAGSWGGGILHSLFVAYQEAIARYGATDAVPQHSVPSYVSFHGLFGDTF